MPEGTRRIADPSRGVRAGGKRSYAVACSSAFRDAVLDLAARRGVNAGELVRSVLLLLPRAAIAALPDPGEPDAGDRETVVLQSGPGRGKSLRRKPRLQLRLPARHGAAEIRRALALALALDRGAFALTLEDGAAPLAADRAVRAEDEAARLRTLLGALLFQPLAGGIRSRNDALYVLGLPPGARPDAAALRTRFRLLATIHHPDGALGDHRRMSQLNEAVAWLRAGMQ